MPRTSSEPASAGDPVGRSDLGRRLATRREELGLSREEVAERSGADASYIAYLEERASAPGIGTLVRLADALGTTVAELSGTSTDLPPGRPAADRDTRLVALDEAECCRLLSTHGVGRVATYNAEGPSVLPVNYVVTGREIAFRTSSDGDLARAAGSDVAFEVDHIDDAMRQGWSVLATGRAATVTESADVQRLDVAARSLPWAGGNRPLWMTVTPHKITGRRVTHR
ncbi:pyridoxamine 5'-phosphate oxidase family protein [Streptomyces sp. NPDC006670]|uniref:helix-turn-helix domain-containing protein n=1 Tax=Streptomyces sp. NPDC006670 TaxID=3154476 RepID=UPI0033C78920